MYIVLSYILFIIVFICLLLELVSEYYKKEIFYNVVQDTYWREYKKCDHGTNLKDISGVNNLKKHYLERGYEEYESGSRKLYFKKYKQCLNRSDFERLEKEKVEGPSIDQTILPDDWNDYKNKVNLPDNTSEYEAKQHWNRDGYYRWINGEFTIKKYNRNVTYKDLLEMGDILVKAN